MAMGKPKALQGAGGLAALAQILVAEIRSAGPRLWAMMARVRNWLRPRPPAQSPRPNGI